VSHRVLVVDDHPLVAMGLELALSARGLHVETTSGPTVAAVIDHARALEPHCVVLDVHLGGEIGSGVSLIGRLSLTGASVVMLTGESDELLLACCIEEGAVGWIPKQSSLDEVLASIEDVLVGRPLVGRARREAILAELRARRADARRAISPFDALSRREQRVLGALIDGLSADEIAANDVVALATIRSQIRAILQKLGVCSQLAAVALANRAGWRPPDRALRLVGADS
jgi:DNA-binding NarL/FixJ family response regulator